MKVVVFPHTPPPHHGQSYMVELMLRGFERTEFGIECFHVNARFAADSQDIGRLRISKVFRLLGYCARAIWLRFRHGAANFYYIPAPPRRRDLFRDWIILLICRPFFRRLIFHWAAAGLGQWLEDQPRWMRAISQLALGRADLSVSLGEFNKKDAALLKPKREAVAPNGIPDPCVNFAEIKQRRQTRLRERQSSSAGGIKVLYLGFCTPTKGLLDAMRALVAANDASKKEKQPFLFELTLAGDFLERADEKAFHDAMEELGRPESIRYVGFVAGKEKTRLLEDSDILCFPTYYYAESFGLVIAEAMAFGMGIVATRWRSIPELFPANYPGLVDIKSPEQIARALRTLAVRDDAEAFRQRFLANYTVERFLSNLAAAFHEVESTD